MNKLTSIFQSIKTEVKGQKILEINLSMFEIFFEEKKLHQLILKLGHQEIQIR